MIRTATGAQRYNARKDKIFDQARAFKYASAYPKLIAALKDARKWLPLTMSDDSPQAKVDALLRELGEV